MVLMRSAQEIEWVNGCANVSTTRPDAATIKQLQNKNAGRGVFHIAAIPANGSTLLIPPCNWGVGCKAVVSVTFPFGYDDLLQQVSAQYGVPTTDLRVPAVLHGGAYVGPGIQVYVLPCDSFPCPAIQWQEREYNPRHWAG